MGPHQNPYNTYKDTKKKHIHKNKRKGREMTRTMTFISDFDIEKAHTALFEVAPGFVKKFFANTANNQVCGHVIIGFYPEKKQIIAYPCDKAGMIEDQEWFFCQPVEENDGLIEAFYQLVCQIKGIQPEKQEVA
jgi:hypothetical protein